MSNLAPKSSSEMRLSKKDCEILVAIERGDVTWRRHAHRSYRLWSSETEYTLITPAMKRIVAAGLAETQMTAGYAYRDRGFVELTPAGKAAFSGHAQVVCGTCMDDEQL